ncbi:hypothetical protein MNB_SV-13-74 [hydrothermal vent metagenome]|uniref:DUF4276 family protein n=1 Tax=hydrothermal vent metagenome TaxID=652676 RepID=A0A1W1D0B5_9ZZZZ
MVKSLILCEGGDDEAFIRLFLKSLKSDLRKIEIKKLSSKSNFFKLKMYQDENILAKIDTQYNKILFIFDSDYKETGETNNGFYKSKSSIEEIIIKIKEYLGFDFYTDYYIVCNPITKNGNLEHLILSTLDKKPKECMEDLLNCIKPYHTDSNKKILLTGYKTIFKEPLYNFSHPNFNLLKQKLQALG